MNADAQSVAQMAQHFQESPIMSQGDELNSLKRKANDDGTPSQQRSRRNRYVSIACNECKRRKIKCNGETPCQRCGNLSLECVYAPNCCTNFKDTQEYKDMSAQIALLQDQVATLYEGMGRLRAQIAESDSLQRQMRQAFMIDPSLQSTSQVHPRAPPYQGLEDASDAPTGGPISPDATRPRSGARNQQHSFRGPTSSDFSFGVAKSSLQTMGITSQAEEENGHDGAGAGTTEPSPVRTPPPRQMLQSFHATKDPIWQISQEEALRLCGVYEDEMGLMYPVVDMEKVITYAKRLYKFMEAAFRTGLMQQGFPGSDTIDDEDTNVLKLVLATALTVEASGRSELGQRLFEYVQPAIDRMLLGRVGVKGITLLTMTAMYEFHRYNEGTSWRIIGLTARLCIELGLHRREAYDAIQDESERSEVILLFWSIFILDRRWSFGTGMPFALQDADIDPSLPKPEDRSPYLSAMIQYSSISSQVWKMSTSMSSSTGTVSADDLEKMNYLDYQTLQWLRNLPAHLRYDHPNQLAGMPSTKDAAQSRVGHRLRILLYLRANQMRILIYRPVLHSATSIMQHREHAQTVVDVAKDTIRVLTHTNQTSDLYKTQQVLFNAFLTSALAVLFLAVSHTPAVFAEEVREEFYMALELVRGFSKVSWVSKRLWKTIRMLKEVGPKLGLAASEADSGQIQVRSAKDDLDSSRSAAVAMAGLAGHNVDEMALYDGNGHQWSASGNSSSPERMAKDLTSLFEAAGVNQSLGGANGGQDGVYGPTPQAGAVDSLPEGGYTPGDEGVTNILRELF